MKNSIGYFLQDYLDEFSVLDEPQHWIMLFKENLFGEMTKYAALEMPSDASCQGRNWLFPNGGRITLASLESSTVIGADRVLCFNDGSPYSPEDIKLLSKWKKN
jgi:hypothetical protein